METSISDIPSDIQLNIISFLQPIDISSFALTSRHFSALCSPSSSSLWFAICDRRWGAKTNIQKWSAAPSRRLYNTLLHFENVIGFWHLTAKGNPESPSLVLFEWCGSCITGFAISPSQTRASYSVRKIPFLWLGFSAAGRILGYLHLVNSPSDSGVIPVKIRFKWSNNYMVVERGRFYMDPLLVVGSPPNRVMSEMYQYFANRASPGSRRWRRKKGKKRLKRCEKFKADHFVKISNYFSTPTKPLQGLWKGITEDMRLEFYHVTHHDNKGITCQRSGVSAGNFAKYSPMFWTFSTTFLEPPFSKEEHDIYSMRDHIGCVGSVHPNMDREIFTGIMCIKRSYDLAGNVEGRIWEYEDGTFGFGFLRNNFIVDLKHIALDGYIISDVESSHQTYVL